MRNAELKELDPVQLSAQWRTTFIRTSGDVEAHPERRLSTGDTLSIRTWYFTSGSLAGQPVLGTLRRHLAVDLEQVLREAEAILTKAGY